MVGNPEDYFAPGIQSKHRFAVSYCGEFETIWDGTSVAVRAHARALANTGIPVVLQSFSHTVIDEHGFAAPVYATGIPDQVASEVGDLIQMTATSLYPVIRHLVVRSGEHLRQVIVPKGIRAAASSSQSVEEGMRLREQAYGATIIYSVWERDRIDPEIARHLSKVRQCWVPSTHNALMLEASGVPRDRIHVVPHPFDPSDKLHVLTTRPPDIHKGWKLFYSIGRWEPRKAYHELIGAFLQAYQYSDPARLTIKYTGGTWQDYPSPKESLQYWAEHPNVRALGWTPLKIEARVELIGERISRDKIVRLHFRNNIYVAASHGEAWCLPAFEAKLAGNALVHVAYGGTSDFSSLDDLRVQSWPGLVHSSYGWEPGAQWADFNVGDLSAVLKQAQIPDSHVRDAKLDAYTMKAVGQQMVKLILEATSTRPEVQSYLREQLLP